VIRHIDWFAAGATLVLLVLAGWLLVGAERERLEVGRRPDCFASLAVPLHRDEDGPLLATTGDDRVLAAVVSGIDSPAQLVADFSDFHHPRVHGTERTCGTIGTNGT